MGTFSFYTYTFTIFHPSACHHIYFIPFINYQLTGVADEVESYPCRHCPDRVFLTSFGLERHTKMAHPEHLDVVLQEITRIQDEWRRRETERGKQRERIALAKIRQESLAAVAAREAISN